MASKGFSIENIVKAASKTSEKTGKSKIRTQNSDKPKIVSAQDEEPSINDLLKTKKKKKKPRYLYFEPDTDCALGKLGERVGKANGGASAVVEAALEEFFFNHDFSEVIGPYRSDKKD